MPFAGTKTGPFVGEFSNRNLASRAKEIAGRRTKKFVSDLAPEIEAEIERAMAQRLVADRPPERRKPGPRAKGSMRVTVTGTDPVQLHVRSVASTKKIAALEYGSRPHTITARNADLLAFPKTDSQSVARSGGGLVRLESGRKPTPRAFRAGYGPGTTKSGKTKSGPRHWTQIESVNHPGNRPYGFIRNAIRNVLRRHGL